MPELAANIVLMDSVRENRMQLGRTWPYEGTIPAGTVLLSTATAARLRVEKGDTIILRVSIPWTIRHAMKPLQDNYVCLHALLVHSRCTVIACL